MCHGGQHSRVMVFHVNYLINFDQQIDYCFQLSNFVYKNNSKNINFNFWQELHFLDKNRRQTGLAVANSSYFNTRFNTYSTQISTHIEEHFNV